MKTRFLSTTCLLLAAWLPLGAFARRAYATVNLSLRDGPDTTTRSSPYCRPAAMSTSRLTGEAPAPNAQRPPKKDGDRKGHDQDHGS